MKSLLKAEGDRTFLGFMDFITFVYQNWVRGNKMKNKICEFKREQLKSGLGLTDF